MRKSVLFSLMVLILGASGGCASAGYGSLPAVVAANAALPYQILAASGWAQQSVYGGMPYGQFGNVPICRLQDLQGLPPINVSQPVLVRVSKSKRHQTKDVVGGAAIGAGLGGLSGGWQGAGYGGAAGAGGGLLVANHEQEFCLLLPVKAP